jgi:hypothetical protein
MDNFKQIKSDLVEAIKAIEKKHSVLVQVERFVNSKHDFSIKLTGTSLEESQKPTGREADLFKRMARSVGLDPRILGKPVKAMGKSYVVLGMTGTLGRYLKLRSTSGRIVYLPPKVIKV